MKTRSILTSVAALFAATATPTLDVRAQSDSQALTDVCLLVGGDTGFLTAQYEAFLADFLTATMPQFYTLLTEESCDDEVDNDCDGQVNEGCSTSTQAVCGNGTVEGQEECDDGNLFNFDGCRNDCTIGEHCGDGIINGLEQCDDGNRINGDGCSRRCRLENNESGARCGDGIVNQPSEVCDDGNASNTDACTTTCQQARCGDGFLQAGVEECEPGAEETTSPLCDSQCNSVVQYNLTVLSTDGLALSDVKIIQVEPSPLEPKEDTTDSTGKAMLKVADKNSRFVYRVEKPGYTSQVLILDTPDFGTVLTREVVLKHADLANLYRDGDTMTARSQRTGAKAVFSAGSFTEPVAEVYVTSVDVSNPMELPAFPGSFTGITDEATPRESEIVSMGVVDFSFRNAQNEELDLVPGQEATIFIPINMSHLPNGDEVAAGMQIALWSLNESTGIWEQEGEGTVVNLEGAFFLQANVGHFSWWNCDVAVQTATAEVLVTINGDLSITDFGLPSDMLARITGNVEGLARGPAETAAPIGTRSGPLFIPATGEEVCFSAEICYRTTSECIAYSGETCLVPVPDEVYPIDLNLDIVVSGALDIEIRPLNYFAFDEATNEISVYDGQPLDFELLAKDIQLEMDYEVIAGTLPPGLTFGDRQGLRAAISGRPTVVNTAGTSITIRATNGTTTVDTQVSIKVLDSGIFPLQLDDYVSLLNPDAAINEDADPVFNLQHAVFQGRALDWRLLEGPLMWDRYDETQGNGIYVPVPGASATLTTEGRLTVTGLDNTANYELSFTIEAFDAHDMIYKEFVVKTYYPDHPCAQFYCW